MNKRLPTTPSPVLPKATVSEDKGVRFLHLGTDIVQGAMRLANPDAIELEYVQQMMMWLLFNQEPRRIAQLGLGSAALTKFCYRYFPDASITAVELNPSVIDICRSRFALPPDDERLQVLEADALNFVLDPRRHGCFDVLQVDLYDAQARGPVLDTPQFYEACANCLSADGILTVNLFGDYAGYAKNLDALELAFDAVAWLPFVHEENIIAIAFKEAPAIDFADLYERASAIRKQMNLRAKSWVNGLKEWMLRET